MIEHSAQPILIVEDSDDDFEATERALKKNGNLVNEIYRCESGAEAIDFLLRQGSYSVPEDAPRPGIVLLDLNMPGKDGRAVLTEMKNNSELSRIPVIVLTTSNDAKDIEQCYQMGANTYVVKPVHMDNLVNAVSRLKDYWFEIAVLPRGISK